MPTVIGSADDKSPEPQPEIQAVKLIPLSATGQPLPYVDTQSSPGQPLPSTFPLPADDMAATAISIDVNSVLLDRVLLAACSEAAQDLSCASTSSGVEGMLKFSHTLHT